MGEFINVERAVVEHGEEIKEEFMVNQSTHHHQAHQSGELCHGSVRGELQASLVDPPGTHATSNASELHRGLGDR